MDSDKSFRNLDVWKNGLKLAIEIYKITLKFPKSETYGLIDQIRRASNSIIANIAESQGRYYFADRIRVLYQARGEIFEIRSHLSLALELKYIDIGLFKKIDNDYEILAKQTSSLIFYLDKKKNARPIF